MEQMIAPYRRYFDFQGRSTRSEYWLFRLFQAIVLLVLAVIGSVAGGGQDDTSAGSVVTMSLFGLFFVASIIPMLSVAVRRLHDSDKSGWFLLIGVIPFGGLVLLIFYLLDGTPGPNTYGADPKGRGGPRTAEVFS